MRHNRGCLSNILYSVHLKSIGSTVKTLWSGNHWNTSLVSSSSFNIDDKYLKWVLICNFCKSLILNLRGQDLIVFSQILNRTLTSSSCAQIKLWTMTMPNWAINMNVQANHTKNINNMNIYITYNLGYNPFQIYNHRQQRCKQYRLSSKLQLSGQTSNFVQYGSNMWAEVSLCKQWQD